MNAITRLCILGLALGFAATAFARDGEPEPVGGAVTSETVAQPAEVGRFVFGLRVGYSLPMGSASKNLDGSSNKLTDTASGQVPLWLDLGYMVTPNVMLGLYGQYGFAIVSGKLKAACDRAFSRGVVCKVYDIRFGIQGQYDVSPMADINPWFGLGLGYEMLTVNAFATGQDGSVTDKGFEFVNAHAGVDFKPAPNFGIGPFVSISLGQYSSVSTSGSYRSSSPGGDIVNKGWHEWLTFGVRGAFMH